jgi:DNA-binding SARP family transcriptional activator
MTGDLHERALLRSGERRGGTRREDVEDGRTDRVAIRLFDGFGVTVDGRRMLLPLHVQRLLAYLAIVRCTARPAVAGALWPETSDQHARGALRTSVWRIQKLVPDLLVVSPRTVQLGPRVEVDVAQFLVRAHAVLAQPSADLTAVLAVPLDWYQLLPGWEDDWLPFERERLRQLRLHLLETRVRALLAHGDLAGALGTARLALATDPLHEGANRAIIRAYLAAGDREAAHRQLEAFQSGCGCLPDTAEVRSMGVLSVAG